MSDETDADDETTESFEQKPFEAVTYGGHALVAVDTDDGLKLHNRHRWSAMQVADVIRDEMNGVDVEVRTNQVRIKRTDEYSPALDESLIDTLTEYGFRIRKIRTERMGDSAIIDIGVGTTDGV